MKSFIKKLLTQVYAQQMQRIIAVHQPKIIAVVGSVGKTSTKIAIAKVLSQHYKVQVQTGNYNTPISIPFIFFGRSLPALYNPFGWLAAWWAGQKIIHGEFPYDVVVVELGTDKPGDIGEFKSILRPTISVVSAISEEHMEFFANVDAVAAEELTIASFSDVLVVNADDIDKKYLTTYVAKDVPLHTYGFGADAEYKVIAQRNDHHQFTVTIQLQGGKSVTADIAVAATHSVKTVAAAVAVADLLGVPADMIKQGMAKVTPVSGRMQLLGGVKNSIIIDDTYNASPLAVEAAVKTLYEMDAPQHIAILGMMNELGEGSQEAHEKIGKLCDPKELDLVVTVGRDANSYLADTAEQKGCKVLRATSPYHAGHLVAEHVQSRAVILVKGSQNGVFTEEAVKILLANRTDSVQLVRQNKFWLSKKSQQFPGEAA